MTADNVAVQLNNHFREQYGHQPLTKEEFAMAKKQVVEDVTPENLAAPELGNEATTVGTFPGHEEKPFLVLAEFRTEDHGKQYHASQAIKALGALGVDAKTVAVIDGLETHLLVDASNALRDTEQVPA